MNILLFLFVQTCADPPSHSHTTTPQCNNNKQILAGGGEAQQHLSTTHSLLSLLGNLTCHSHSHASSLLPPLQIQYYVPIITRCNHL